MNENLVYTLIALFSGAIIVLLLVIFKQLKSQKQRVAEQKAKEDAFRAEAQERQRYLIESIRLISNAILHDDKITMTEGCMRLKVMVDNYDLSLHQIPELEVIEEVYVRSCHIPILDDWKALSRKEQREFEKEIAAIEAECQDRVRIAAKHLLDHPMHKVH